MIERRFPNDTVLPSLKEYREIGIPITKSDYLAAHEFAEKEISEKGLIEPWFNFYFTLHTKLSLTNQISYFKRIIIRQSMYSKVCPTTGHDLL